MASPEDDMASVKERAQAAFYDSIVLTVLGTLVLTTISWLSGWALFDRPGVPIVAVAAMVAVAALYEIPATALTGQTLGKSLVGIRVVGLDGSVPGWRRAVRRWVLFVPVGFMQETAMFGFLLAGSSVAADPEHRGVHDRFAGTMVIRVVDTASTDPLRPRKRH
ncbi:MAG: RDD family protein [Acidimicrobiales bacterium]